jgi:hypothetical protein
VNKNETAAILVFSVATAVLRLLMFLVWVVLVIRGDVLLATIPRLL